MSATATAASRPAVTPAQLAAGLPAFSAVMLGLAAFMAIAPHAFYTSIGPFGAGNDHYVRDVSTFYAALGIGLALSIRRASWRVPLLAVSTIQFALHSINHLFAITEAHPRWIGWLDFLSLLGATIQLARLLQLAARAHDIKESA